MATVKDFAALYGVETEEEFILEKGQPYERFRFTDNGLEEKGGMLGDSWGICKSPNILQELITGKLGIKKIWKPTLGETYYFVTGFGVESDTWGDGVLQKVEYAFGNCFKTREKAEAHKKEIIERLEEIYKNGNQLIEW